MPFVMAQGWEHLYRMGVKGTIKHGVKLMKALWEVEVGVSRKQGTCRGSPAQG